MEIWRRSKDVLSELIEYSTVFIGGINEINELLETNFSYSNEDFIEASKQLIERYPIHRKSI